MVSDSRWSSWINILTNLDFLLFQSNQHRFASHLLLKLQSWVTLKSTLLISVRRWVLIFRNLDIKFWVWFWLISYLGNWFLSLEVPDCSLSLSLSLSCDGSHWWKPRLRCQKTNPIVRQEFTFLGKQCQWCSLKNPFKTSHTNQLTPLVISKLLLIKR